MYSELRRGSQNIPNHFFLSSKHAMDNSSNNVKKLLEKKT